MGWGMTLAGFANAVNVLEAIKAEWSGGTLYLVGPTVRYAIYNELGTSKMEARPFMEPAAERVQANPEAYATRMASTHGIDISSESGFVRALALAVQDESKRIANAKGVRDTGDLIASISIEKIQ
jgi:hypothetical protein